MVRTGHRAGTRDHNTGTSTPGPAALPAKCRAGQRYTPRVTGANPPHPGVRFPPPLIHAAGFVAALLLERRYPLPLTAPPQAAWREGVSLLVIAIAAAFLLGAMTRFWRSRTPLIPHKPATTLVQTGVYRLSRNPMYVGLTALYLGLTGLLNSYWPLVFLPAVVVLLQALVIRREERYLRGAFGADYAAYCARVRRWL